MKIIFSKKSKQAFSISEKIILINAKIAALEELKQTHEKNKDSTAIFFLNLELKDLTAHREHKIKELKTIEKF